MVSMVFVDLFACRDLVMAMNKTITIFRTQLNRVEWADQIRAM
jgi:hypothetical protein